MHDDVPSNPHDASRKSIRACKACFVREIASKSACVDEPHHEAAHFQGRRLLFCSIHWVQMETPVSEIHYISHCNCRTTAGRVYRRKPGLASHVNRDIADRRAQSWNCFLTGTFWQWKQRYAYTSLTPSVTKATGGMLSEANALLKILPMLLSRLVSSFSGQLLAKQYPGLLRLV